MGEEPWFTKHRHAAALVQSYALTKGIGRVRDEGDVARVAGRLMADYVDPYLRGASGPDRLKLYEEIAAQVRFFRVPEQGQRRKAPAGASIAAPVRPTEVADPVEHFSGEFVHDATDLTIRGAGIDFAFHRTYRHQTIYDGPLGHRWDHGYNAFLTLNDVNASLWTGTGRQEHYRRHATHDYYVPPDGVDATLEPLGVPNAPAGWIRRAPDGLRHVFEPASDWSGAFRLARIEDRWGNYLRFEHVDGRLDRCYVNHEARWVRFHYDEEGRIVRVADFTGRAWRYVYDGHGDLIYVISPATTTRARGCVTEYRYSSSEHSVGPLAHNLTDIFDPEGRHYLRTKYGTSVGMEDYNRVVFQRAAHGDFWFRYGAVDATDGVDRPVQDRPAFRCWVKERNGYQTLSVYNAAGNLIRKEETHKQPGIRSTRAVWRYRYNRDGQLVASRSPEGVVTHLLTGRDHFYRRHRVDPNEPDAEESLWRLDALTAAERRGFARVLSTVQRARRHAATAFDWSDRWGDVYAAAPDDIIVKRAYEPAYGQLVTVSDPRATTSPDPDASEPADYHRLLTRFEYAGPAGDPTRDLVRTIAPTPTLPNGTPSGPVIAEILERDPRGRVVRARDAAGTEFRTDYYLETDPDNVNGRRTGFVRRTVVDPGDLSAGHLNLTTEFGLDELGRVETTTRPRGMESADGRFVERARYDSLDRVIVATGPTPLAFETRTRYEPAGKPERIEVDWLTPDPDQPGVMQSRGVLVRRYKYNEEHQVVKETWGGEDIGRHHRIARKYDAAGTLRFTMAANDTTIHFRYDSRDQLVKTIRSYGVAGESTETLVRDRDGRIVAKRSGEGSAEVYEVNVFGQVVAVVDPLGHVTRTSFDKGGRPTVVRRFERRADGSYWLLSRSEVHYDELGRAIRAIANRFDEPIQVFDVVRDHENGPGPGQRVETQTFLDAAGRVVAVVDPLGHTTTTAYDAAGRVVRVTDPLGNSVETTYDAHGNAIRRDRRDRVLNVDGNVIGEEVLSWTGSYDERDRLIAESDGLGNTTEYEYDSLDRRVRTRDALGNVTELDYDVYGYVASTTARRTDDGLGTGQPLPPATVRYERDASGIVRARIDALGRRTEYRHDRSNRVIEEIFPDGARVVTRYDRDDRVIAVRDLHGVLLRHDYDEAGRLRRTQVDDAERDADVELQGARLVEHTYDGLGRLTRSRHEAVDLATQYNSLGHPVADDAVVDGSPFRVERTHDDAGRLTGLRYPSGRLVRFERDALGHLIELVHEVDGTAYPGAPSPAPRPLARHAYAGNRLRRTERPNGVATTVNHDAAGRRVEIRHDAAWGSLLRTQQFHDGARNPRLRCEAVGTIARPVPETGEAERFGYDAQYQLTARAEAAPVAFIDVAAFAPPATPQAPLPHRQPAIDSAIGPRLPPAPAEPADRWVLDLVGNRLQSTALGGASRSYTLDEGGRDQYARVDATAHAYDRAGNLVSDGQFAYAYDAWRRLCRVTRIANGDVVARYLYDPAGRRVVEESAHGRLVAIHDGVDRIADYATDECVAQYVHGDAVDDPLHAATAGLDAWYHVDQQGSVRALTDTSGSVLGSYRYDPFGNLVEQAGAPLATPSTTAAQQPFGFGGRPFDAPTGLYDQRTRSYAPVLGRFLQRDPGGPVDGTNLYTYAGNHPLAFGDPMGMDRRALERYADERAREGMEAKPYYQSIPWYDEAVDFAHREVVPRVAGAARAATGVGLMHAGIAIALVPGLEVVGGVVGTIGLDQAQAGVRQAWSGKPVHSELNKAARELSGSQWFADHFEAAALGAAGGTTAALMPMPPSAPPPARPSTGVIERGPTSSPPSGPRLVVGGGRAEGFPRLKSGDVSLNIRPDAKPHVVGDIADAPFAAQSFSSVYFERVPFFSILKREFASIDESARVLRPGGELIVHTGEKAGEVSDFLSKIRSVFTDVHVDPSHSGKITARKP